MVKRLFALLIFLLFMPTILSATICDSIKSDTLKPAKKKKSKLILPIVLSSPETDFGAGVVGAILFKMKKDTSVRTSNVQGFAVYTVKNQFILETGGTLFFPKEDFIVRWTGTFAHFPDKFFGIGNDSKKS